MAILELDNHKVDYYCYVDEYSCPLDSYNTNWNTLESIDATAAASATVTTDLVPDSVLGLDPILTIYDCHDYDNVF